MSENWSCVPSNAQGSRPAALSHQGAFPRCRYAMRRYSRFQGYSFAAALGAGLLVWGGVKLGEAKERRDDEAAAAGAAAPKHA